MNLETIVEDFEFIEDWEDRYKYIIDLGKSLDPLSDNDYSKVWLVIKEEQIKEKTILEFKADSDSFLVKGLLTIIISIFSGKAPSDILKINYDNELKKLNLKENISQQRSNGLTAVINKVISEAQKRV